MEERFWVVYACDTEWEIKGLFTNQSDGVQMTLDIGNGAICFLQTLKQIKNQLLKEQLGVLYGALMCLADTQFQQQTSKFSTGEMK